MSWIELVPALLVCAVALVAPGTLVARAAGVPFWLALGVGPGLTVAFFTVLATVLARTGTAWAPGSVGLVTLVCVVVLAGAAAGARRLAGSPRPFTGLLPGTDERGPSSDWSVRPLAPEPFVRAAPAAHPSPRGPDGAPLRAEPTAVSAGTSTGPARAWRSAATWVRLPTRWTWRAWTVVALVLSSLVVLVPTMVGMGAPDAPLQQWDAVFHLNGLALMQETGDASQLNGLYGAGASVYYPTAWHALVSLVVSAGAPLTGSTITGAANASTLVMSVVWLVGVAAFARAVFPRRPAVTVLAALLVSAFSMFPTVQLSTLAQWPNGLSTALIPGAAAALVVSLRSWSARAGGGTVTGLVVGLLALGAAGGVALAQPGGFVGLVVVVAPFVVAVAVVAAQAAWRDGNRAGVLGVLGVLGAVVVGGAVVLSRSSVVEMVFGFDRLPQRSLPLSVLRLLSDTLLSPVPGNLVVSVLVVVGAVVLVRRREERWLVASTLVVVALAALAAGPENPLRALTGIWYTQAARIEAFYPVTAALLAAIGGLAVVARLQTSERVRSAARGRAWVMTPAALTSLLLVVSFVTSLGFQAPQRAVRYAEAYDPAHIKWGTMLSEEEIDLMRDLPDLVGDDAVILGDPFAGASYAWSLGRTQVVLPQLNISGLDASRQVLVEHFDDILVDPRVCRAVDALHVTHLYVDTATPEEGAKPSPLGPALSEVDLSEGFELVATAGTAALYAVTACD